MDVLLPSLLGCQAACMMLKILKTRSVSKVGLGMAAWTRVIYVAWLSDRVKHSSNIEAFH